MRRLCTSATDSVPKSASGEAFFAICDRLGIHDRLLVRNEALSAIGGSALTDRNIDVPESHAMGRDIPVTYVPFRNAHFLSVAVSWAEVLGAEPDVHRRGGAGQFGVSRLPSGILPGIQ